MTLTHKLFGKGAEVLLLRFLSLVGLLHTHYLHKFQQRTSTCLPRLHMSHCTVEMTHGCVKDDLDVPAQEQDHDFSAPFGCVSISWRMCNQSASTGLRWQRRRRLV